MGASEKTRKRRVVLVLIDGLGDVSLPRFRQKTPLQVAEVPNLDAIAAAGVNGLMDPVEAGLACGSDTAHLSLLGYDPRVYYRGRGAFESMGAGLAMSPGDIAFKSNFATLDESTGIVTSRRADRHFEEEGPVLCEALDGIKLPSFPGYQVRVRYATEHRCGVVVKGPNLSGNISGTDPLKDNRLLLKAEALDGTEEAKNTAAVVNELSQQMSKVLISHPSIANIVLLRGCGIRIEVPSFMESHGLRPCMVAPTKIIAGLGLSLGIDILEAPGATGDYRTLLTSKAIAIAQALSAPLQPCPRVFVPGEDEYKQGFADGYDFGFLHIKAIDDAGHDKASLYKVRALEAVDKAIGQLAKLLWQAEASGSFKYYLCVTGDHSTPVEYGDHSFEPVPFALCRLEDFVGAAGGEAAVMGTPLDSFSLPSAKAGEDLAEELPPAEGKRHEAQRAFAGDSVSELSEVVAARGCLGRFPGSEMMGIIKKFMKQKNE
ncbi:unnamed protein product [Spirodela intermedia]|uniref:Metalloenzyme domain-containing protein n=1 Tax=Spirodela intermedia TaxID=51605 RepID=A0A7I8JKI5_SPIIN|nr:unnamed protein product [Spirodela intermedia]CAA6670658.1 unnamed protein product [Spirodela intermedia]